MLHSVSSCATLSGPVRIQDVPCDTLWLGWLHSFKVRDFLPFSMNNVICSICNTFKPRRFPNVPTYNNHQHNSRCLRHNTKERRTSFLLLLEIDIFELRWGSQLHQHRNGKDHQMHNNSNCNCICIYSFQNF